MPLYSSLGNRARLYLKKKKEIGHKHTHGDNHLRTQGTGGCLQVLLREASEGTNLNLGLPAYRIVKKSVFVVLATLCVALVMSAPAN